MRLILESLPNDFLVLFFTFIITNILYNFYVNSYTHKEYFYDGAKWIELGDEGHHVSKSFVLNGHELTASQLNLTGSDIFVANGIYSGMSIDNALDQLSSDAKDYVDKAV